MDPLPTPHPAIKSNNDSRPKINSKVNQAAPKTGTAEPKIQSRQNRVFGTARSINIVEKPVSNKTRITKPKFGVPRKQPKPIQTTQVPVDTNTKTEANEKKTPENVVSPRLNKKSGDAFQSQQRQVEKTRRNSSQEKKDSSAEPKTPVMASTHVRTSKAKVVPATPFYTAMHCSKCRFDRLETSSYWIGQIKMAESVGKHFIAADFFRLALESQAEPTRNLRIELRRYLLRHGYLSEQKEWSEVAARYGLLKVENNTSRILDSSAESSNTCTKIESDINVTGITIPDE